MDLSHANIIRRNSSVVARLKDANRVIMQLKVKYVLGS